MKPAQRYRSNSLSPWISPNLRPRPVAGQLPENSCVLLVDDRPAFRHEVLSQLQVHAVQVLAATGAYDAWRLAGRRDVDLIVIRGDLASQSGWQCAAKLCGCPPWKGVIMHFDGLSDVDRTWGSAAELTGLVESSGRPQTVVASVLRALKSAPAETGFPDSRPLVWEHRV